MALLKNPGGFSEGNPTLQFLDDDKSDIETSIDSLHFVREYVQDLPVPVMRPINNEHLESLMESDPNAWPPILVTFTSRGYVCYDGQHRIQAAMLKNRHIIRARSKNFKNLNELIEATFRANLIHGLPTSLTTKSDYCYWLHITSPKMTQNDIAKKVGVNQSTVQRAIEQRERKQQEASKGETTTPEKAEDTKLKQTQQFTKSTGKFLKVASDLLKTVKTEEYDDFVWNLQVEILNGPDDKQQLQRVGKLLIDIAKARRKAKVSA